MSRNELDSLIVKLENNLKSFDVTNQGSDKCSLILTDLRNLYKKNNSLFNSSDIKYINEIKSIIAEKTIYIKKGIIKKLDETIDTKSLVESKKDENSDVILNVESKTHLVDITDDKLNVVTNIIQNENMLYDLIKIDSEVSHNIFGYGTIVDISKDHVKVKFKNEIISFNKEVCSSDGVLKRINNKALKTQKYIDQLIKKSNNLYDGDIFNKESILVNKEIVENNIKEIIYFERLAESYKSVNKLEEAIEIYREIVRMDKNNKIAKDNLFLYGRSLYQKYINKSFNGAYRDVFSPPEEVLKEWHDEEMKKINKQLSNRSNENINS